MKKTISIIACALLCTAFTQLSIKSNSTDDAIYKKSVILDLSFEARLESHRREREALENYYTNISHQKQQVLDVLDYMIECLGKDVLAQHDFMVKNNIDLDDLRQRPEELRSLSAEEKNIYNHNLLITQDKFAISFNDITKIDDMVHKLENQVSYDLHCTLLTFQEYMHLAQGIHYTKLEMIEDVTGFKNPIEYMQNNISSLDQNRKNKGLCSREAIRKLKDLGSYMQEETTIVYPNPFIGSTNFQFYSQGKVECIIYDLAGKKIKQVINAVNLLPYTNVEWNATDENGKRVAKGLYIAYIRTSEGKQVIKLIVQ